MLAFGNGGSATDAMDLVADLRCPPRRAGAAARRSTSPRTPAILTALANDIGAEVLFAAPGDRLRPRRATSLLALSTSGGSANIVAALAEARRRGLRDVAFVGYDGGRIGAERLADHVVVTPSQHIPRIQEAQASAYHALRELIEIALKGSDPVWRTAPRVRPCSRTISAKPWPPGTTTRSTSSPRRPPSSPWSTSWPSWPATGAALELGIGTGRIALPLARRGVPVHGIDLSPAMVARLRAKPGAEDIGVTMGDFATTRVDGTFSRRLPGVQHDQEPDHAGRAGRVLPQRRARTSSPAGCFVIEVGVPDLQRLPPGETFRPFT